MIWMINFVWLLPIPDIFRNIAAVNVSTFIGKTEFVMWKSKAKVLPFFLIIYYYFLTNYWQVIPKKKWHSRLRCHLTNIEGHNFLHINLSLKLILK
jgi:hypothetical protein